MKQLSVNQSVKEFTEDLANEKQYGFIFKSKDDIKVLLKLYINLIEYFSFFRGEWLNLLKKQEE
jgi:hypothetical protein